MRSTDTTIPGVRLLEPVVYEDERGFFMETYQIDTFQDLGITSRFVQDNHSRSIKNVIRGLKFQFAPATDKLVRVSMGRVYAVVLDLRPDSPTFKQWESFELSEENKKLLFMPSGCAFGFCVLSETAEVLYKLSALHTPAGNGTIRYNDPDLAIPWPTNTPIVTDVDKAAPTLAEWIATGGLERVRA